MAANTTNLRSNGRTVETVFDPDPLEYARKIRGLTMSDLAKMTRVSLTTISLTLNGHTANVKTIAALAAILGVAIEDCYRSEPVSSRTANHKPSKARKQGPAPGASKQAK